VTLNLSGCLVGESSYLRKVEEADSLTKELDSLKQKHAALMADNRALKTEYEIIHGEAAVLISDKQALARDNKELVQVLEARSETLYQNISDLRQKVTTLESENKRLKENITDLQRVREDKTREISSTYEKLLQNMKSEIAQGVVVISELKGKLTVKMEAAILFDSGKADVSAGGVEVMHKMVDTLKGVRDKAVRIEGHTDNLPVTGDLAVISPGNWELSAARVINVTKYLQQQGLDPAMLSAAAYAEFKPVTSDETKEVRAKKHRIEITVVATD